MPWEPGEFVPGKGYPVRNKLNGKVKGYSKTKAAQKKYLAALYANTTDTEKPKRRKR